MSTQTCPITGRPLPDGHTIHPATTKTLQERAQTLTELHSAALAVIGGQSKHATPGTHTKPTRDRINWQQVEDLALIETDTITIAQMIDYEADTFDKAAQTLTSKAAIIPRHPYARTIYYTLEHIHRRLITTVDTPPAKTVVQCDACEQSFYAPTGRPQATCTVCGAVVEVKTRQAEMFEDAAYTWLPKQQALQIAQIITGKTITERRLKYLRQTNKIETLKVGARVLYQAVQIVNAAG